jgi:hypothetical protein
MGIRYLTSKSSQVIAQIQVLDPRSRLNGPLLVAGLVETTLAFAALAAWTVLDRAVVLGRILVGGPAFLFWLISGALLLTCAFRILSGSRSAPWRVPLDHAVLAVAAGADLGPWTGDLHTGWRSLTAAGFAGFAAWTVALTGILVLSRAHLTRAGEERR